MTEHWLSVDHWSTGVELNTNHPRLAALDETGYVRLRPPTEQIPAGEWRDLVYMDWKSGGDTRFAPVATATGELECRGFWSERDERPDKGASFTENAARCPTIVDWVRSVGADFGRVRVIELEPQDRDQAKRQLHRDDNNRFNPDSDGWVVRCFLNLTDDPHSYLLLMDSAADGLPDPATEARVSLPAGSCTLIDTQRLWHAVCHVGAEPRYCLISSFESGPALQAWVEQQSLTPTDV